jgi:hypothetical protein
VTADDLLGFVTWSISSKLSSHALSLVSVDGWGQASLIFPESTVAYEPAIYAGHLLAGLRRLRKTFYLQVWCEIDLEVVGMKRSSHFPSDAEHRRSLIDYGIN